MRWPNMTNALSSPLKLDASGMPGQAKYMQLRDTLLAQIESGRWQPGARLPTETDLTRQTALSLGTVQRALRALVEDGVVVRQQGNGTFVADSRKPMDAPWHCRFIADDGKSFLPIYPKVLVRTRIRESGPWSALLEQRGNNIVRIDRVISINDEFSVYSKFYLNGSRFAGILKRPLTELDGVNLKALLGREFGLPVTHITQSMSTAAFPTEVCRALKQATGAVGTVLEIAASTGRGRHVYFQSLYIPSNRRRLVVSDTYNPKYIWLHSAASPGKAK
jgi:DNA-binding GntR family transcriptional regulator